MRLRFENSVAEQVWGGVATPSFLGPQAAQALRKKLGYVRRAATYEDVWAMNSVGVFALPGEQNGRSAIPLTGRWYIVVEFGDDEDSKPGAVVVDITDRDPEGGTS